MLPEQYNYYGYYDYGFPPNPAYQTHSGYGYDPENYISTAKLIPEPYTTTDLIQAKFQGVSELIQAVDDDGTGNLNKAILDNIIQNVTTEINGYLSSVYPIPLAQIGTVAILKITDVDSNGVVQPDGIEVLWAGNYNTAPSTINYPAYLRYIDPLANQHWFGDNWNCQQGTGLSLTVSYKQVPYSDESGQLLNANVIDTVSVSTGGTGYENCQLIVLTGGSSFVPAKVREAAISLICYDLLQRRLNPNESNLYAMNNKKWRGGKNGEDGLLSRIGDGDISLDGTYRRFYSAGFSWNQRSVLQGANSL